MRPVAVTLSSQTISPPIVLDVNNASFAIGLNITVTGSNTSKVQYSFDDPFATYVTDYNTDAVWQDHPILTSIAATTSSNFAFPPRACRLNCTAYTNGSCKLTVVQTGIIA